MQAQAKLDTKNDTIEKIAILRQEKESMQTEIEAFEIDIKERNRQYKGVVEIVKDEEVKLNRLDVELENRLDYITRGILLKF